MLERACRKASQVGGTNYPLAASDAYPLQFSHESMDLLINNFIFDLLPEKDFPLVLSEFRRVLRWRAFTGRQWDRPGLLHRHIRQFENTARGSA